MKPLKTQTLTAKCDHQDQGKPCLRCLTCVHHQIITQCALCLREKKRAELCIHHKPKYHCLLCNSCRHGLHKLDCVLCNIYGSMKNDPMVVHELYDTIDTKARKTKDLPPKKRRLPLTQSTR